MMMTKLKKIFCGLFFALAVCSHAVDVAPFDMTQENWDELMKFKMWAKGYITMAGSASVPDTVGAIGAGDSIILLNGNHTLGGPIYTGGIRADYGPDEFITGPVRARNYFLAGANGNKFHGTYCIGNEYSYDINENAINGISAAGGTLLTGSSATTGKCATDKVPLVPNIWIPDIDKNASFNETIDGISISNSIYAIDVPNNVDVYDVHVEGNISFSNTAKLHIRMKTPQTLVRIFVEGSIEGSSATQIQVVYVNESAEYDASKHRWSGVTDSILVGNKDYAGNVLFYSKGDISFPSMNPDAFVQGSFMSRTLINLGANMSLAGQALASKLYIGPDFNGENLLYVPFDPSVFEATLAIEASALNGKFLENGADALIPIELNAKAEIDVLFKYCFDVKSNSSEGQASVEDFDASSLTFPVCDKNEYGQVVINMGSSEPTDASKIFINVKKDDVSEDDEILPLKIFDLSGAVLPENKHEGYFNLTIGDNAGVTPKFAGSEKYYSISENSLTGFMVARIPVENVSVVDELIVTLEDNAASGQTRASDILNLSLDSDDGSVYAVLSVKDGSMLDYERIPSSYNVTLTLKDQDGVAGCNQDTIIRTINIMDVNEMPYFTDVGPFAIMENSPVGTLVGEVKAADNDLVSAFNTLYYTIPVNEDNDPDNDVPFAIANSKSGKITVANKEALDYEDSSIPEHKFEFMVQVSDGEFKKDTLVIINLVDVNDSPDDAEPPVIIPECEGDNCLEICLGDKCEICVGESCHETCVENCDKPCDPVKVLTVAVNENVPTGYTIMNYLVSDADYGAGHTKDLTASIKNTNSSGADSLFVVEMKKNANGDWRVVISVKDGSKLDYEKVKETHSVTIYVYDPEDPAGMYDSLLRVIKVVDVNEAPKANDVNLKASENLPKGTVIGKVDVTDPDVKHVKEFGHLEYSIIGKDETFVFVMDSSKVVVNDPSKMDYELNVLSYIFDVQIANCELNGASGKYDGACLYDTATVTVYIQTINEPPIIVVDGPTPDGEDDSDSLCIAFCDTTSRGVTKNDTLTVGVRENTAESLLSPTGKILFQYHVVDEDTDHVAGAKVTWFDVGSSISSVKTNGTDLFAIDYKNGVITVSVKDEKLLDYEALRNAKSRSDPDPEYTMGIVVTDPLGLADTLYRKIRVIDVNEKPIFEVWPPVITENNLVGDSVGYVEHPSDIDSLSRNPAFYDNSIKMTGGDTTLFSLVKDPDDLKRIMLVANVVVDCENGEYVCGQDSVYWIELTYGDTTLKDLYAELKVPVKLIDLNEPPEILIETVFVNENTPKGTVVDTVKWFDVDRYDTVMNFKMVRDPTDCFAIDERTGVLSVKTDECAALDYEKNESVVITVSATDMADVKDRSLIAGDPITVNKMIMVKIQDVNEPPSVMDEVVTVKENTIVGVIIDTIRATDPDKDPKFTELTYALIGGDTATFKIDSKSGFLMLNDILDYEERESYNLVVRVDDGEFADTAKVKINVENVEEWNKVDTTQASDSASSDTTKIVFNDAVAEVTISTTVQMLDGSNANRITEKVADDDINLYVNKTSDTVYVKLKDAVSKTDTVFTLSYNLETVSVSESIFTKITSVAKQEVKLNENPENGASQILLNGSIIKVSYTESVKNVDVTVSYKIDSKGAVVKQAVVNEKNKIDSVETIVVSYKTKIENKNVEISYLADASTGELLVKDSLGALLTKLAAQSRPSMGLGYYYVTYSDGAAASMMVTYSVDSKGDVVKNAEGDVGYEVSYTFEDEYGRSTTQVINVVLDQTVPKVEILSPENNQVLRSNRADVRWCVDGILQDTLNVEMLEPGVNLIVREYCDKAGNCDADSVIVICKGDACSEEIFAEPTFRVVMTGPFQFTIVLDWASNNALQKNYAVMDLQGRILQQGVIGSAETVVPVLTSGSYIVKVGRGKRVVNVR